jgi:hypothetical protein
VTDELTPVKDAARNRFTLIRKTIALSRGEPRLTQAEWWTAVDDLCGKHLMLAAAWIAPGEGNQGIAVDYFTEKRVRIRSWGRGPCYEVALFTPSPSYHLMVDVAIMTGLLNGDLS